MLYNGDAGEMAMANISLIQVRTSTEDKEKPSEILEKLGTNLSAVVNMMIKQIMKRNGKMTARKYHLRKYCKRKA